VIKMLQIYTLLFFYHIFAFLLKKVNIDILHQF